MPIPPGCLGNLTPEQETKLKEFWVATLKVFGVEDPSGQSSTAQSLPPASTAGRSASTAATDTKKEKKGLFHRKHKDNASATSGSGSPAFSSSSDPEDKYGQTREFQEILASSSPESLRVAFWGMVKQDHPDALLLRFLRARKWDVQKALAMLVSTMHWRSTEMRVDDEIVKSGEAGALLDSTSASDATTKKEGADFLAQLRLGKSFIHGADKDGRPMCYVRVRLHKSGEQSERSIERYTVYVIETTRLALTPPVETATIVFDMTGFTLANMDYAPVKFMIKVFEANYPESLGTVLVHKAPWVFQGIWKIIRGWLDPVVAGKVHFTNNVDELSEFVPRSQIIKDLGGQEDWEYKYIEPQPGENDVMKDIQRLRPIEEERRRDVVEYQNQTFEWIRTGSAEVEASRDRLAKNLYANYWKMDSFIRARTLYDRTGMFQGGGKINYFPTQTLKSQNVVNGRPNAGPSADDLD